jgi:O-acetyl-ADP-ribose deacetylase (regulator of RNase III)
MNIHIERGDITRCAVDAIVNAANAGLLGGGGVDGAIHRAGGATIAAECALIRERQGGCATGSAVSTGGGSLKCKYVIHTVGPIWGATGGKDHELLRSCYESSMRLAQNLGCVSIAFPNISTGVYGFPPDQAAELVYALFTDETFVASVSGVRDVYFVNFEKKNVELYRRFFKK